MNYLMYIDQTNRRLKPPPAPVQFLVSGHDDRVRDTVMENLIRQTRAAGRSLVVVSDADNSTALDTVQRAGYRLDNGMNGSYHLCNPFRSIGSINGLSRLRQLLTIMEYKEQQKGKLSAYLNFLRHLEFLKTGSQNLDLTLSKIAEYSTTLAVTNALQNLLNQGRITQDQMQVYLSKYAECAAAAADFEDMLFLLLPFTQEGGQRLNDAPPGTAVVFPTEALGDDEILRQLILKLLLFSLEDPNMSNTTVLVIDKGYGNRAGIAGLLSALPGHIDLHVFSDDIFTLCDAPTLAMIQNRFSARVYSRHLNMSSAKAIETACGDVEVVKKTYTVDYDRRLRANRPLDVLFGLNKTEHYGDAAPTLEPLFPKETILQLAPGTGIVQYMGSSTLFPF